MGERTALQHPFPEPLIVYNTTRAQGWSSVVSVFPGIHKALTKAPQKTGMMAHTYNPSPEEMEAGGSEVQGHPQLYSGFKVTRDPISNQPLPPCRR